MLTTPYLSQEHVQANQSHDIIGKSSPAGPVSRCGVTPYRYAPRMILYLVLAQLCGSNCLALHSTSLVETVVDTFLHIVTE